MKSKVLTYATVNALLLLCGSGLSLAQQSKSAPPQPTAMSNSEWIRLREALKQAKPMPIPPNSRPGSALKTPANGLSRFNPVTGETTASPSADATGTIPTVGSSREQKLAVPPTRAGGTADEIRGDGHEGSGTLSASGVHPAITPTPPGPLGNPYNFPFNSVFRLLMRFNVNGTDYYYLCSASAASDFHLISAGHCVYNHDPINNGSGVGAKFADEIWAWPAETDVVDPVNPDSWPDFPYGVAKMTWEVTYNAWINNSDFNWDFSFITLDRRIGDHTGWMGREWGFNASSLNFDGYPAEFPYVPSDNPYQYPGFDAGNVSYYTCCRIGMAAYTYGGHSGGPVWRFDGTNRYVEGVNSTSDRHGSAQATQLTGSIETDLNNQIAADQSARPPADLAQVIEYVFNNSSKGLNSSSVAIGSAFSMTMNAFNAGYIDAGDTTADVYLTSDPNNVSSGHYIGTHDFGYIGTYQFAVQNTNMTVPATIPPGGYYVGYLLHSANSQYGTDRNDVVIESSSLQVFCNSDSFEPDNSFSQAHVITSGSSQSRTICAQSDQDWAKFTVGQRSSATIFTSGPTGGDTTLTLYNSSLTQIAFNDDNGTLYSTITRTCAANALPPGTYYVQVQSFNNATVLPSYNLSLTTSSCAPTVTLSPGSLNFGSQAVNTTSAAKPVTLTNTGSTALSIASISTTGNFAQTHTCGSTLAAGAHCVINVTFHPTAGGTRTGTLVVHDNAGNSPQSVSLTGTGTAVKLSPTSLAFPTTTVGHVSAAKVVTLTNAGSTALSISSISFTGTNTADFTKTTTCGGSLGAGAHCTVTVKFAPKASGPRVAALSFTDNGGASPQKVALSGTGQ